MGKEKLEEYTERQKDRQNITINVPLMSKTNENYPKLINHELLRASSLYCFTNKYNSVCRQFIQLLVYNIKFIP